MVVANAAFTGNCLRCHSNGYSPGFGMKIILGMRTVLSDPDTTHWRTLLFRDFSKINLVPLQRPSLGLMFLNNMRGIPGLIRRLWGGKPLGVKLLRYSTLNLNKSSVFWSSSAEA